MIYLYRTIRSAYPEIILFGLLIFTLQACGGGSDPSSKNKAPTVTVSIADDNAGGTIVGDSLTGSYIYTDTEKDKQGATSYRWLRNGIAIGGANALTYTVVLADRNRTITFEVTPLAVTGTLTGSATLSVGLTVASQTIDGSPIAIEVNITDENAGFTLLNDVLTGSYTYTDADGDDEGVSTFRWLRNGVAIAGANVATYIVVADDVGQSISFEVTAVALVGRTLVGNPVTSTELFVVDPLADNPPTASDVVIIDDNGGNAEVGDNLTGTYAYGDIDRDPEGTTTFRWLRNGGNIDGANLTTYTADIADVGQSITFEVSPVAQTGVTTVGTSVGSLALVIKSADTSAPQVDIEFPPSRSLTDDSSVTVHGLASDANTITSIRVNGIEAITNDNYLNWSVVVPLASGLNILTVETSDSVANTDANAAEIRITAVAPADLLSTNFPDANNAFKSAKGLALDSSNTRLLVTDSSLKAVIAVDLGTGVRTVLASGAGFSTLDPSSLAGVRDIIIDSVNNRALVTDTSLGRVVSVNLDTGKQAILTNDTNTFNMFQLPTDIALDSNNNRALVTETSAAQVTAVNLDTGARTPLSSGSNLLNPTGIDVDYVNNRALVIEDSTNKLIAVDLGSTGTQTVLPPMITITAVSAIAVDTSNNQALMLEGGVVAMDLTTGVKTDISNSNKPNARNYYPIIDIIMSESKNRALLLSSQTIMAVYLPTGERVIVSK